MYSRHLTLRTALCCATLASIAYTTPAHADISWASGSPPKWDTSNHAGSISRQDCADDLEESYGLVVSQNGDSVLDVWAGTGSDDCTQTNPRPASCKLLSTTTLTGTTASIPIKATDLIGVVSGTDTAACTGPNTATTVQLFFIESISGTPTNYLTSAESSDLSLSIDLVGPAAPTIKVTSGGSTALRITASQASDVTDASGLNAYCVAADSAADAECAAAAALTPGSLPDLDATVSATSNSSTSIDVTGLTEATNYACVVSTLDALDNPGPLSPLGCGVPAEVNGADDAVSDVPSFCTASAARPSGQLGWLWASLAVLGLALRLRVRRPRCA